MINYISKTICVSVLLQNKIFMPNILLNNISTYIFVMYTTLFIIYLHMDINDNINICVFLKFVLQLRIEHQNNVIV